MANPCTHKITGNREAQDEAEHLLQTHGRMGAMAIAIAILKDIDPDDFARTNAKLETYWIGRFT